MKIFAFTKTGLTRIVATSLMLSVYIITIILNFASQGYTAGNFFATLFFCLSLAVFSIFAKLKNHPPLLIGARGWQTASAGMFFLAIIFTAVDAQFSGFIGELVGYAVMLLLSPYFGLFYLIDVDWTYADYLLGVLGIIITFLIGIMPDVMDKIIRRKRMIKKYS